MSGIGTAIVIEIETEKETGIATGKAADVEKIVRDIKVLEGIAYLVFTLVICCRCASIFCQQRYRRCGTENVY